MRIVKRFSAPIFIVLVASLLAVVWFHDGFILGTAEAKIPFYNLERFREITSWAWTDFNLGNSTSLIIASGPTWWFLSQIQGTGIPGFIIQAFCFWFIFISAGMGIYWLTKTLFPDLGKRYLILAVLFYFFNPLSLVNVWNRFLYNYMVFWALLPVALFILIKGLKERKLILGVMLALTLTLFSYALSGYVFNLLIWFVLIFTWLFFIFIYLEKKFIFYSVKFFVLILVSFMLLNFFWVLPTFNYVTSASTAKEISSFVTTEGNLYTLNILSQKLGNLIDISRLTQFVFYLNEGPKWASFYLSPVLIIIMFTISGLILFGIYRQKRDKGALFLGILFVLGVFLAKGNNPPFGKLFQFFFEKISVLQIFRDPFEKFGFILSLSAAPLFALGVREFSGIFNNRIKAPIYFISLFFILGVLGYPFFTGLVFTSKSPPNDDYLIGYKVKVPDYYKQANDWLESQGNNFRFIGFPLGDEGMTFKWEKGYQGVEPSEILFSTPGITFNTTIPYYSQIAEKLERLLFQQEDFYKVANLLNVRYFMVRNDVDIRERRLRMPEAIVAVLSRNEKEGKVKKVAQFGELTFWENLKWENRTVYVATNIVSVSPQAKIIEVLFPQVEDQVVLVGPIDIAKDKESLNIIYPETNVFYKKQQRCFQLIGDFENPKKYSVNIDEQSEYELLLDDVNLSSNEASLAARFKVSVDDQLLQSTDQFIGGNRISYGKVNLTAGKHEISIIRPASSNLVSAPDDIILKTPKGNNQASFKIENFNPYSRYLINFDYVTKSGQQLIFYFQQNNDMTREGKIIAECLNPNILNQGSNFSDSINVSDIYAPKRSDEAGVLFSVSPGQDTEATIKNLSVNRLIEPQPILVKRNPVVTAEVPLITYTKINPTKYSVRVSGAKDSFILVLSELFNNGWIARFDDNTTANTHFLANAYANGWLIDKTGDFNLTLEFSPQRLLDIGKIISGLSILGGLIYIGSTLLKKKGI